MNKNNVFVAMWISVSLSVCVGLLITKNPFCLLAFAAPCFLTLFGWMLD